MSRKGLGFPLRGEPLERRAMLSAEAAVAEIANQPPIADAGGPYYGLFHQELTLQGTAVDPDNSPDEFTFEWDLDYDGASFEVDLTGATPTFVYQIVGTRTIALRVTDPSGARSIDYTTLQVGEPGIGVVGRRVFYNNSRHDGKDPAANPADDLAIASDKAALLPGQTASFTNYTSYNRGINGLMIDFAGFLTDIQRSDFVFKGGKGDTPPPSWSLVSVNPVFSIRPGAGVGGSLRLTLIFPDYAIQNEWLQVTVKANGHTGLAAPDVFNFGNAVGESGNVPGDFSVSLADELAATNDAASIIPGATVTNRFDYNRDGTVSVIDQLLARNNITTGATKLRQITVPDALVASGIATLELVTALIPIGEPPFVSIPVRQTSTIHRDSECARFKATLQPQSLEATYGECVNVRGFATPERSLDSVIELL